MTIHSIIRSTEIGKAPYCVVTEFYDDIFVGGIPARDGGWHDRPVTRRAAKPYMSHWYYFPSMVAVDSYLSTHVRKEDKVVYLEE